MQNHVDTFWSSTAAQNAQRVQDCIAQGWTPIIFDLNGDGFEFTSTADPVEFDINADGELETLSWTSAGSDDAFLVLDRNGNGQIDDATELFGNFTPLHKEKHTSNNGYEGLAYFDRKKAGSNKDGLISLDDQIYSELQLWLDDNHNGISEPNELASLESVGIREISLDYVAAPIFDENGNILLYFSEVVIQQDGEHRVTISTDVVFDILE